MNVNETDLSLPEKLLLPDGCHFSTEAKAVINCWESREVLACPGSGKTTVLLAKLKLLADRMPLKDGRGVCVISHTNVAVNELKGKLGDSVEKLLSYPNFVGTLQTFVDQYITFPYLKQYTNKPIQVMDRTDYSIALFSLSSMKYRTLTAFINQQYKNTYSSVYPDKLSFLAAIYSYNGDLYVRINGKPKRLAGAASTSALNYSAAVNDLLLEEGMIRYEDAYKYTLHALTDYGDSLRKLLSRRFQYVFVDEYQDCSEMQRNVLDKIFADSESILQKIGDVDQAIYSNDGDDTPDWQVAGNYLSIAATNRYGQEIADVLTLLLSNRDKIHSERGICGIKPTLLLCDDTSRYSVLTAFVNEIKTNDLARLSGTYKAVGMYKNVSGLKIGDYWSVFQADTSNKTGFHYPDIIYHICMELTAGNLFKAERNIRKLLCRVYHYQGVKAQNGKEFSVNSIKQYLAVKHSSTYQISVLQLAELQTYDYASVNGHITKLLYGLLGPTAFDKLPAAFLNSTYNVTVNKANVNTYEDDESGIAISFDTVFGVKGETHDATLYLETEKSNGTDLKRIMPLLEGKSIKGKSDIYEKSRKCVYVGFSRPRHLLCLAMKKSTYQGHETAFANWKIVDLT